MMLRKYLVLTILVLLPYSSSLAAQRLMVADFELWPNNLDGEIGVYGGGEPNWDKPVHSWYYSIETPGYNPENVKFGNKSFRLVNAMKPNAAVWATFAVDLGPTLDVNVEPKKVKSLDVSDFNYLTFWIRGEVGGEKFRVVFRDAHASSYQHETVLVPLPQGTPDQWTFVKIPLSKIKNRVDLKKLDMVGLHFGRNVGNPKGAILYVDDIMFTKE